MCSNSALVQDSIEFVRLLEVLSGPNLDSAGINAVRKQTSDDRFDWSRVLQMAEWHRLTPFLYRHVKELSNVIPQSIVAELSDANLFNSRRALALAAELLTITNYLRSLGISNLAYKGPVLAYQLYGEVAARITSDLDLLVRPEDVEQTRDALTALGYQDSNGLSRSQQAASFRYGFEHSFCRMNKLAVDLHWRIVPSFVSPSLDTAGIWNRAIEVDFFGKCALTFSPEDLFVVLCLHAGQHEWAHIGLLVDIVQLIKIHPNMDWNIVYRHMRDPNTIRTIAVSCYLVHSGWDIAFPEEISRLWIEDEYVRRVAESVRTSAWTKCFMPTDLGWALERTKGEPWRARLRYLRMFLNPQMADFTACRVPRWLIAGYPFFRAVRLTCKYVYRVISPKTRRRTTALGKG